MQLNKPFCKLPLRFDVQRLRDEIGALPAAAWAPHPNGVAGNSSVRLISVDGEENDLVDGAMAETPYLARLPYVRQILASLRVPWSRTRLLRLAPGAGVPAHADINYHWFYRVRLHIPIITRPEVRFFCDGVDVHMGAGEAWIFDNWRLHNVTNPTPDERIHLVADTVGNAAFWQLAARGETTQDSLKQLVYQPDSETTLLTERSTLRPVMNPAELELLVGNLRGELVATSDTVRARQQLGHYHALLGAFVRDWRHFYVMHGEDERGWQDFASLRDALRAVSRPASEGIVLRTNRVVAHQVLEGRVLRVCVSAGPAVATPQKAVRPPASRAELLADNSHLRAPVFIVAAPRSGSTLLFETLASSEQFVSLGGEAHWLVESIAELAPGAAGVSSNRLVAAQATPPIIERIHSQILEKLVDRNGTPLTGPDSRIFLEKTPKNSLRIPFLDRIFPDARFVFLWREPRGNVSSIMEAWKSGRWQTYRHLEGFELPWSLLLPPGWEAMRGRTLAEIAAFQWNTTNRIVLDDLSDMPSHRWTMLNYDTFIDNPEKSIGLVCEHLQLGLDPSLRKTLSGPLTAAKHTLTPPDPHKWRRNEGAIAQVMPLMEDTWQRLLDVAQLHRSGQEPV